jgi:hypothetical protein
MITVVEAIVIGMTGAAAWLAYRRRNGRADTMPPHSDVPKNGMWWIEIGAVAVGLAGIAALFPYHLNDSQGREVMMLSAAPYGILLLGSYIARNLIKSIHMQTVTALLAVVLTVLSLLILFGGNKGGGHSGGIALFVLPFFWMIGIPIVLAMFVACALVAEHYRKR